MLYVADRNVAFYRLDLSTKEGVIRFVGFLYGVQKLASDLKARFDSVREGLLMRMRTVEGRAALRWSLHSQIKEYNL